jgi:hypothetical protein
MQTAYHIKIWRIILVIDWAVLLDREVHHYLEDQYVDHQLGERCEPVNLHFILQLLFHVLFRVVALRVDVSMRSIFMLSSMCRTKGLSFILVEKLNTRELLLLTKVMHDYCPKIVWLWIGDYQSIFDHHVPDFQKRASCSLTLWWTPRSSGYSKTPRWTAWQHGSWNCNSLQVNWIRNSKDVWFSFISPPGGFKADVNRFNTWSFTWTACTWWSSACPTPSWTPWASSRCQPVL